MTDKVTMLEERTRLYWDLSFVWNARTDEYVAVGDAIEWCSNATHCTRPEFALKQCTKHLLDDIIEGIPTSPQFDTKILPLEKPIKKTRKQQS